MIKLQIPKNRINYLLQQLQAHFDTTELEQGWEDFHKGVVHDVEMVDSTVSAKVGVPHRYRVTIDLDTFAGSECECGQGPRCRHEAAVIFQLYSPFGRPELLLNQLKQEVKARRKTNLGRQAKKAPDRNVTPAPKDSVLSWHKYFEGQFYGYTLSHQTSVESFYTSAWEKLTGYAADWDAPIRAIYELNVLLFMMKRIEQFYQETQTSYLSYHLEKGCRAAAQQSVEQWNEVVGRTEREQLSSVKAKLHETLELLGKLALQAKDTPVEWLAAYRSIWSKLAESEATAKEMQRLDQLLAKTDLTPRKRDVLAIARAHFDVIRGQDEAARNRLSGLSRKEIGDFFGYLDTFYAQRDWERMLEWLRWLKPALPRAKQDEFRAVCQYWMDTVNHLDSDEEWVKVMLELLPRTYYYYTAYLLQSQRYKQWVDLQLSNHISPLNLYSTELKAVEGADGMLLLPLYHQSVERSIMEKNRASYKTAVKLLKKLEGLYKKTGRELLWQEYIYRLSIKYSRLRAFQEELRKGKWIL